MITTKPLRPPLGASKPPGAASSAGRPQGSATQQTERAPVCRKCGREGTRPLAPGWYMLRRTIARNSVPPDIYDAEARARWAKQTLQPMGLFCSVECLVRSADRLKNLDHVFREKGVGLKPLGETAPARTQQPAVRDGAMAVAEVS